MIVAPVYERSGNNRFNTAAVIDADGDLLGVYRKYHVPSCHADSYEPFFFHQPTLGFPVFDTRAGRIGLSICYDRHFPEIARIYGLAGVQVLINVSTTGGAMSERVWELEQQAHALANGYFVAAVNRLGSGEPCDSAEFFGRSYVCAPDGQIRAQAGRATDEVLLADLNLDETTRIRERWHTNRLFADLRPATYHPGSSITPFGSNPANKEKPMTVEIRQLRYKPIMTEEMKQAAVAALEDGRLIRSNYDPDSEGGRFEADVTAYLGVKHGVAVSSGWAAMHVAFLAAGIGPGDEVITVPNTFISVGDVIELVGPVRFSSTLTRGPSIWTRAAWKLRSRLARGQSCQSTQTDLRARWVLSTKSPGDTTCSCWSTRVRPWEAHIGAAEATHSAILRHSALSATSR